MKRELLLPLKTKKEVRKMAEIQAKVVEENIEKEEKKCQIVQFVAPTPLPKKVTFTNILENTKKRLEELIKQNPNAIVDIHGRYEITRPVALAIKSFLRDTIIAIGGNVRFKVSEPKVIEETQEMTVKVSCIIELPNGQIIEEEALGSCSIGEITAKNSRNVRSYHDAVATAETRSIKRLIETILGEDIINKLILEVKGSFEPQKDKETLKKEFLEKVRKINEERKRKGKQPFSVEFLLKNAYNKGIISKSVKTLNDLSREDLESLVKSLR